jgi:hypothetical protein
MPTIAPGIDASVIACPIAASSWVANGALASTPDVADPTGVDGTVDEHADDATIKVAIIATTTGRMRATQNRMNNDPVICGSFAKGWKGIWQLSGAAAVKGGT